MKSILCALLLVPSLGFSGPKCQEGNALKGLPKEKLQQAAALGGQWLTHVIYCDFGTFQVMASTDPKSNAIMVFKATRPIVSIEQDSGINLIQDYPAKKGVPYLSVQDWDHSGLFRRLDYSLVDDSGNILGNAQDKIMSGSVVVTKYSLQQPRTP
jgi:hypothetical protein